MSSQWGQPPSTPRHPEPRHPAPTPRRPWYRKKRWVVPLGLLAVVLVFGRMGGPDTPSVAIQPAASTAPATSSPAAAGVIKKTPPTARKKAPAETVVAPVSTTKPAVKAKPKPKPKPKPKKKAGCDPNYSGACVPIAYDVDCGGGSGDGPKYFYGVAEVTGSDIYDLDRDGDGQACES